MGRLAGSLNSKVKVSLGQQGTDLLHPIERLDPALRLFGLAGLGLEAVDEFLEVGDLVLLLGKCRLLQLHLFGAHVFKLAVVAAVTHQFGCVDVQGDVGHGIEKLAVVADDDHGAFVLFQPGLQPDQGVQIEVVGRLVKQQQV